MKARTSKYDGKRVMIVGGGDSVAAVKQAARAGLLVAESHVLRDGENRDEHEVLVHHPDSGGDRERMAPLPNERPENRSRRAQRDKDGGEAENEQERHEARGRGERRSPGPG